MKYLFISCLIIIYSINAFAQQKSNPSINAFQRGEKLTFKLYYKSAVTGNVSAGELTSEIKPEQSIIEGFPSYHVIMEGKTKGAFNWFFKIRDHFESYIDEHYLAPRLFKKRIQEGDYNTQRNVRFNQEAGIISYHNLKNGQKGTVNTTYKVQDLVSSLYHIRNWNFDNAYEGEKYVLSVFLDDSVYQIQFEYLGTQEVKTDLGKIQCIVFKPKMLTGGVFDDESPMTVYVSDDKNHLPILVISEVAVGSVRMELKEYTGLSHSFSIN